MLHRITIACEILEGTAIPQCGWGLRLHGFLMRCLPPAISQELHTMQTRPFSQHVQPLSARKLHWLISLWDDGLVAHFAEALLPLQRIELDISKYLRVSLMVTQATHQQISFDSLLSEVPATSLCHLQFITPTAHGGNGDYVIFPSPALIYHSIIHRIAPFIPNDADFQDRTLVPALSQQTSLQQYTLRSTLYPITGVFLNGYTGDVSLRFHGSESRRIQSGKVLRLAAFTGIGIKTAMGMGGCHTTFRLKSRSIS